MATLHFVLMMCAVCFSLGTPSAVHYGCEELGHMENGGHTPKQYFYPLGSTVWFHCNHGYELEGVSWTVCTYNKKTGQALWIHSRPTCKRKLHYICMSDSIYLLFLARRDRTNTIMHNGCLLILSASNILHENKCSCSWSTYLSTFQLYSISES